MHCSQFFEVFVNVYKRMMIIYMGFWREKCWSLSCLLDKFWRRQGDGKRKKDFPPPNRRGVVNQAFTEKKQLVREDKYRDASSFFGVSQEKNQVVGIVLCSKQFLK